MAELTRKPHIRMWRGVWYAIRFSPQADHLSLAAKGWCAARNGRR